MRYVWKPKEKVVKLYVAGHVFKHGVPRELRATATDEDIALMKSKGVKQVRASKKKLEVEETHETQSKTVKIEDVEDVADSDAAGSDLHEVGDVKFKSLGD